MKQIRTMLVAILALTFPVIASAIPVGTLWYSGDGTTSNWGNQAPSANADAITHWQAFEVTDANGWTIDSVYSVGNNYGSTTADWSIRTGMGSGNGGTTFASGTQQSVTPTLFSGSTYFNQVDIAPLFLDQGVYWLSVALSSGGSIRGTTGTNSVGSTPALHSIRNWPLYNQNYAPYSSTILSSGVTGSVGVPAPAVLALFGLGLAGFGMSRRRKVS